MNLNRETTRFRAAVPLVLAVVLIVIAAIAVTSGLMVRRDIQRRALVELEQDVRDRVHAWESALIDSLADSAEVVASDPYQVAVMQVQLRKNRRWFDSIYLWSPAEKVTRQQQSSTVNGRLLFPDAPLIERSDVLRAIPCLTRARLFASQPGVSVEDAVDAWRTACKGVNPSIEMFAISEAVSELFRAARWQDALDLLDEDGLNVDMTLREAQSLGIPAYRAAVLRLQRADALTKLGREEEAGFLDYRNGLEITDLDARDAEPILHLVAHPILPRVDRLSDNMAVQIDLALQRAKRRVNGYHEVRDELLQRLVPRVPEEPRFLRDQYGDSPFLLFSQWSRAGDYGVALQLDQNLLLEDFLDHMRRFRKDLVITDAAGTQYVAGAREGGSLVLEIPFARTLDHLRIGVREDAVRGRLVQMDLTWSALAIVLALAVIIGLVAIASFDRFSRQQRQLLARQRDFATRVTHELKTPLAGIKVMAENLELGHFANAHERETMARAIVREADNLTERVNEILSVTRERTLRAPERFDPEEPLFELIDLWGPRLETAGLVFAADLNPTDEILGDPAAFRDAVACLLDNAIKYHRPDADPPTVDLIVEQVDGMVRVIVDDNGLGVPEAMRAAIFDRFVRVEGDNRGKAGGHGLGLSQVQQIVQSHNGRVHCEASEGGGARFVIEIPAVS